MAARLIAFCIDAHDPTGLARFWSGVLGWELYGGWATGVAIGDEDSRRHILGLLATHWGLGSDLLTDVFAPEADAGARLALAQYQRAASSAETAVALLRLAYDLDVRAALARIEAPTLVLHRHGDRAAPVAQGRVLADAIPGAELVELEGRSHLPAIGDAESVVAEVRRFLGLPRLRRAVPTGLTARQTEVAALVATASRTVRWPSAWASPNGRPSRTWSGSGCASGSGRAPRSPPGTCDRRAK